MKKKVSSEQQTTLFGAANALGISETTLKRWHARGCPDKKDGVYDITAMKAWADANLKATRPRLSEAEGEVSKAKWSAMREKAMAQLAETKLGKERGELVEIEVVVRDFTEIVVTLMTHVRQLPDSLAGVIDDSQTKTAVRSVLVKRIEDICEQASQSLQSRIDELEEELVA